MRYLTQPAGATPDSISLVEAKYLVGLPVELKEFWLQSDGPILWFGYKELQFFPVREVLEDIYGLDHYMPGALPLCMDGSGNICVARIAEGRVNGYFVASCGNLGWEDAAEISTTFWGLLRDPISPEKKLYA